MLETDNFAALIRRVRAGDTDAAAELVRRYEPELRIIARVKLSDPRLRRLVDSMDICQSILGNFFVRAYAGQFEIDTPDQLMNLLVTMVRNKVTDHARHHTASIRSVGRITDWPADELPIIAEQTTAESAFAIKDLAGEVRQRMSADELVIVDRRMDDMTWEAIATELGSTADAVRKRMTRAIDRVAAELGLTAKNGQKKR